MTESSTRRRFLESLGIASIAGLSGCTQVLEGGSTGETSTTVPPIPDSTETATPEPSFPRRIDLSNPSVPSIEEAYDPGSWLPEEHGEWVLDRADLDNIEQEYDSRTEQVKETLRETTHELRDWVDNARAGAAAVWQTLDWADHNTMMVDVGIVSPGGLAGPAVEVTYENSDGRFQTDVVRIRSTDTIDNFDQLYSEDIQGEDRNYIRVLESSFWKERNLEGDYPSEERREEAFESGRDVVSSLIPGVNADSITYFSEYEGEVERLAADDDYLREMSKAFEAEQAKYMEMKQELARAAEATEGDNALGVHINDQGETIMEELTPEHYREVSPQRFHWDS